MSGGAKLRENLRPGAESILSCATAALRFMVQPPISSASGNSHAQTYIHSCSEWMPEAVNAATMAVTTIDTHPHPGTAVKDEARSIVSRMKRRLSIARPWSEDGSDSVSSSLERSKRIELITCGSYLRQELFDKYLSLTSPLSN